MNIVISNGIPMIRCQAYSMTGGCTLRNSCCPCEMYIPEGGEPMIRIFCDRCGAEIRQDPRRQAILPMYTITKIPTEPGFVAYGANEVHLCRSCEKAFKTFLEGSLDEEK